ncbi:MAG: HesB/IscA family protein [Alphaproteobacteria bacterium]
MTINIDAGAHKRIEELRSSQGRPELMLRVTVEGGGCSGFQYKMELTDSTDANDLVFADALVTDEVSLPYLEGSVLSYEEGLIGSEFTLKNPNATSGCGCGTSFAV